MQKKLATIIVAAGSGRRFGGEKQLAMLNGLPVFLHSVRNFLPTVEQLVVVTPAERQDDFATLATQYGLDSTRITWVAGGAMRSDSVRNALAVLRPDIEFVAIHDAVRPLASARLLRLLAEEASIHGGAAPATPVRDTLLKAGDDGMMTGVTSREGLWAVATPQVFDVKALNEAYCKLDGSSLTDDTQVFFNAGGRVKLVNWPEDNFKITYPEDLARAETIMNEKKKKLFIASPYGFCGGVRRAVEQFDDVARDHAGETIYVLHELVHNKVVTDSMKAQGAVYVNDVSQVPEGSLMFLGAHGVTPAIENECRARRLTVFNAVCPLVQRLQKAAEVIPDDEELVMFGDARHPEVQSILAHAHTTHVRVVGNLDEAQALPRLKRAQLLSQTTRNADEIRTVAEVLQAKSESLDTRYANVCDAVLLRQKAITAIAEKCDLVLIIGSPHSSNAKRLVEIASAHTRAMMIEDAKMLTEDLLSGVDNLGIGAGTSTPDYVINDVMNKAISMGFAMETAEDKHD